MTTMAPRVKAAFSFWPGWNLPMRTSLARPERPQPPPVVVVEAGQGPDVGHEGPPPRSEPGGEQRERQGQPGDDVEVPDQLPPPDQGAERPDVEDGGGGDEDGEQAGVDPVQRQLRPVEPLQPGPGRNVSAPG